MKKLILIFGLLVSYALTSFCASDPTYFDRTTLLFLRPHLMESNIAALAGVNLTNVVNVTNTITVNNITYSTNYTYATNTQTINLTNYNTLNVTNSYYATNLTTLNVTNYQTVTNFTWSTNVVYSTNTVTMTNLNFDTINVGEMRLTNGVAFNMGTAVPFSGTNFIANMSGGIYFVNQTNTTALFTGTTNTLVGYSKSVVYVFQPTNGNFLLDTTNGWYSADATHAWTITNGTIGRLIVEATGTNFVSVAYKTFKQ